MFQENVVEKFKTHILCFNNFFFENHAVYEILWKTTAAHRRQYGAWKLHAIYLGLQIHTQTMYYLLLFHCNDCCTIAPQCYVIVLACLVLLGTNP